MYYPGQGNCLNKKRGKAEKREVGKLGKEGS
jgi:hypothetical protein